MERKERRHHTREFKLEAVRLAAVGDKTKAKVARQLGVRVNQLPEAVSAWCLQDQLKAEIASR